MPESVFDEDLRDVPVNSAATRAYVGQLRSLLESTKTTRQRVSILGQIGVYLRQLGDLDQAESTLKTALDLIEAYDLGIGVEIQQKIRLAHVFQWQRRFTESDKLFGDILSVCRSSSEASHYLDFALQHSGKNHFDQGRWQEALRAFEEALRIRQMRRAPEDFCEFGNL